MMQDCETLDEAIEKNEDDLVKIEHHVQDISMHISNIQRQIKEQQQSNTFYASNNFSILSSKLSQDSNNLNLSVGQIEPQAFSSTLSNSMYFQNLMSQLDHLMNRHQHLLLKHQRVREDIKNIKKYQQEQKAREEERKQEEERFRIFYLKKMEKLAKAKQDK